MTDLAAAWDDPRGLGYHAQVHGTFVPVERWPVVGGARAPWLECAHNHWFFLPWHRAFLLELEAVARGHVADLGGPAAEWGLPYWDYTDHVHDGRRLGLPLPLRGESLPPGVDVPGVEPRGDGSTPNPLHVPGRALTGDPSSPDPAWADATAALQRPHFANQQDSARVSFGGGVLEDATNQALFHDQTSEHGQLDVQPHGSVHGQVHGAMALFQTAGLDPVFWMHHANVDRLWETYARDLGHGYPFADGRGVGTAAHASWTSRRFAFVAGDGSPRTWTAPEVLDTAALGYAYDSTAPPPLPPAPPPPPGSDVDPFGLDEVLPEPVAATAAFALAGPTRVRVGGGGGDLAVAAFPEEARWLLRFEGVRGRAARRDQLPRLPRARRDGGGRPAGRRPPRRPALAVRRVGGHPARRRLPGRRPAPDPGRDRPGARAADDAAAPGRGRAPGAGRPGPRPRRGRAHRRPVVPRGRVSVGLAPATWRAPRAHHPERALLALAVTGWVGLTALTALTALAAAPVVGPTAPHQHTGGTGPTTHLAGAVAMLLVMAPLVATNARFAALRSPRARRSAVVAEITAGWAAVWLVGLAVVAAALHLLRPLGAVPLAALLAAAATAWQLAPARRAALARCHRVIAPPLDRARGGRACRRHGLDVGRGCWTACAPMMALMTVSGHSLLVVAPLTAVAWYERRRRPHHDPGSRPTALVVAAVGALVVALAAW